MSTNTIIYRNNSSFCSKILGYNYKMLTLFPLSDANKKLQDTNDHIQGMVDMPSIGEERYIVTMIEIFSLQAIIPQCHTEDQYKAPVPGRTLWVRVWGEKYKN